MQARTYLPAYGKFAQVDPAYDQTKDDPEMWNLYNYVTNNPVTHTDPDGREAATADLESGTHWGSGNVSSGGMSGQEAQDWVRDLMQNRSSTWAPVSDDKTGEGSQADQKSAKPKKDVVGTLVHGLDKEGAAKEVRDPSNGSVSQAGYGKAHLGITGLELSGGVAKTDRVGLAGPDGRLKFQAHGTEGSLALGAIPTSTTKTTGPGKTETTTTLVPKVNAQISIFKAGFGIQLGGKVYTVGLTAGAGLKLGPGKFELGALVYFSADAVK